MGKNKKQHMDNKKLAVSAAKQFAQEQNLYPLRVADDLYTLFSLEEPKHCRCYVSNRASDDDGEHMVIEWGGDRTMVFVQYFSPDGYVADWVFPDTNDK